MDTVDAKYTTAKITEDTRDILHQVSGLTGETMNSVIRRLVVQEYNRLMGVMPKEIKEPKIEYRVKSRR